MESTYLVHSKKGTTWTKHKYIKKVGNKYIYAEDKISNTDLNKAVNDTLSGKNGTGSTMKKNLGSNYGIVAKTISSKFKKPSGKSGSKSGSSKEKTAKESAGKSSSAAKEKSSQAKSSAASKATTKAAASENAKSASAIPPLKTAITGVAKLGDNDSYIAVQNEDGSTTVTITYEDGSTQEIHLDNRYKVLRVGEKSKPDDKDEKEVKHSHDDRFDSLYYGVTYARRS